MKKLKMTLLTCICLCFCLMGGTIFIACNQEPEEEINPYIKVSGISTACIVGDELDYSNAKILYYTNLTDETPDEYPLTRDMVSDFSSDTAGTRKMKVNYKTLETEMDYTVITEEKFDKIISDAANKIYNAKNIKLDYTISQEFNNEYEEENITLLIKDANTYKTHTSVSGECKDWYILDSSLSHNWYHYSMSKTSGNGGDLTVGQVEIVQNYSSREIVEEDIYFFTHSSNLVNEVIDGNYSKFGSLEIFTLEIMTDETLGIYTIEMNNSKITKTTTVTSALEALKYRDVLTISYDISNETIPSIPENVEFTVENEEFINAYNSAREEVLNATELELISSNPLNESQYIATYLKDDKLYQYQSNEQEFWRVKESDVWYEYIHNVTEETYSKEVAEVQGSALGNAEGCLPSGSPLEIETMEDAIVTYRRVDGKDVYYCVLSEEQTYNILEITLENGKMIFWSIGYKDEHSGEVVSAVTSRISYETDFVIPALPNVQ